MELKHYAANGFVQGDGSFNRTFMELKPEKNDNNRYKFFGFNRTFMELKQTLNVHF